MAVQTTPHLNFTGQAREALEFYQSVFGGTVTIATYADFGMPAGTPTAADVVFGQVIADTGFRVMAYDIPGADRPRPTGETSRKDGMTLTTEQSFLSVRGESVEEVGAYWEKLSVGATVIEAYAPAQWAPAFGMLTDRFGVTWILDVAASH